MADRRCRPERLTGFGRQLLTERMPGPDSGELQMTEVDIGEIDIAEIDIAGDDERLHAAYLIMRDGYLAEQPPYPLEAEPEATASLRSVDPSRMVVRVLLASVHGEPAGTASVSYPQRDNRGTARANHLVVRPEHRRIGVGRSLLDAVVQQVHAAGRSALFGGFRQASPTAPSSGRAFAGAVGATTTGRSLEQVLELATVTAADLERLREEALAVAPAAADYEILRWVDRAPADLVEDWAALRGRMSTDMPPEDRPDEPEVWDAARVRDSERRYGASGRTQLVAAARQRATGELVGYTFLTVARGAPATAYQEDTIVVAGHRGHRLGLLLKADTVARLRTVSPATREVMTWNAVTNSPMLAVNAALGFRVRGEECEVRLAL